MNFCSKCGGKLSDGDLFCTQCGFRMEQQEQQPIQQQPERKHKKWILVCVLVSVAVLAIAGIGILFSKQIGAVVSDIITPKMTISFEVQIPDGESAEQISEKMNSEVYIVKMRLIALGYTDTEVSADQNIVTVKRLPRTADINAVAGYVTSSAYSAELQDVDGNTILANDQFVFAVVLPDYNSSTMTKISLSVTTEGGRLLNTAIKSFTAQTEDRNYILLIVNGKQIAKMKISPDAAQNGFNSSTLSLGVADISQFGFTIEELSKAMNSHGTLPYKLTLAAKVKTQR